MAAALLHVALEQLPTSRLVAVCKDEVECIVRHLAADAHLLAPPAESQPAVEVPLAA